MQRSDGRQAGQVRPVRVELGVQRNPEGSVLWRAGGTTLLVAVSVENKVPDFLQGSGQGWLTAEYAMHPRANPQRKMREGRSGRVDGRSQEIQRLIGRSLRAAIDLSALGERTLSIDCDVLDADGGTRTAAISAGFVALVAALDQLRRRRELNAPLLRAQIAAVSVGILDDRPLVDLCYQEDSKAEIDFNLVGTASGALVEMQGTAESRAWPVEGWMQLLELARPALGQIAAVQTQALQAAGIELAALGATL